ncbi:multidrug efflux SMR transporter [Sphingomonas sp. NFR15]|uniref:DMT family transporter n=1 Tax=Sphingomonas sp. NFR15 TaxID=1566282 RepID=UPI00087FF50B|nr:SMR family transporter [Sphingomonas sp. NFR15]SDA26432.1 quaternary ammonium compound-resistance protein SugE [Sphingomonas sp. NFR15]
MPWIALTIAGLLEIVWAYFMKQSAGFTRPGPAIITVVAMIASFSLLGYAMRSLPLGSAYMIWTGIGALGSFVLGIALLGEAATPGRLIGAALLLAGLLILKMAS